MGRYGYIKFTLSAADNEVIQAIKTALKINHEIDETAVDWNNVEIRIKKADKLQRHRFADTIIKLETFINSPEAIPFYNPYNGDFRINISKFSDITGRNRKTIRDWMNKDFIEGYFLEASQWEACILIKSTIEKLKKA